MKNPITPSPVVSTSEESPVFGEWRPIETAPLDMFVLVSDGESVGEGCWSAYVGEWTGQEGSTWNPSPTHWMPMPPPPGR